MYGGGQEERAPSISLSYYKNLSEKISKLFRIYINYSFRPQLPLKKNLLCKIKPYLSLFDVLIHKYKSKYKIPCKDCDAGYVGKTGRTCNIHLKEHKKSYRKDYLRSKLVIHSLETDHKTDFDNLQILALNCTNFNSQIFLKGWFTKLENSTLN